MTPPIIEVRGVSKEYLIGDEDYAQGNLRESLVQAALAPLRWLRGERAPGRSFLALKEVSFDVAPGQAVGLIGRNGAGKSTLLKLLSRITAPSAGEIRLYGRVASLLEVGTGFHSELTGRENIFLNGAILGMKRAEIVAQLDAIVAFAEVEAFLDTPVKRYSSGMYMRLAFAVAAHLRPEVLVVDEVLAVGDAAFQKKCLGKMRDVADGGRAVIFVSHNMAAVSRLCSRAILLRDGQVAADGPVHGVIGAYLGGHAGESPTEVDFERKGTCPGDGRARLLRACVRGEGPGHGAFDIRRPVEVAFEYELLASGRAVYPSIALFDESGTCVFTASDTLSAAPRPASPGRYRVSARIPGNFLGEGAFSLDLSLGTFEPFEPFFHERGALAFHIHDPAEGDSVRGPHGGPWPGVVRPRLDWHTSRL